MRISPLGTSWCFFGLSMVSTNAFVPSLLRNRKTVKFLKTPLQMSIPNGVDTLTSGLASIARLPFGTVVSSPPSTQDIPRIVALYDMEGSSDCRLVRERITELDLCVENIIPGAPGSRAVTDDTFEFYLGEGAVVPRMIVEDKLRGMLTYEGAEDILGYFTDEFGERAPIIDDTEEEAKKAVVEVLINLLKPVPSLLRFGRGSNIAGCALSYRSMQPLVLYSYEGNQFCRLAREVLSELDITYELRSAGKGSAQRQELEKITGGSTQCPFLIDPNTNTNMPESKAIIEYLYKNYAKFTPPSELLGSVSQVITPLLKPIYKVIAPLQAGSNREDMAEYENEIAATKAGIEKEITSNKVVVYSYSLSPFCTEAIAVLDSLDIEYENISLGLEWIPFLINEGGSQKRAALGALTGQTSLPHVFVAGKSIGGLYEGLIPALEDGSFFDIYQSENDSK